MAARMNRAHQDDVRAKIQTSQLINRLQNYALGSDAIALESGHLKAIEILLRKSLPDLTQTTLEGPGINGEHTLKHEADAAFTEFASQMANVAARAASGPDSAG